MATVTVCGKSVRLRADQVIGKGGEADVYKLSDSQVVKLYKLPNDPDYAHDVAMQQGALLRLDEQQRKLPMFPSGLPVEVVVPTDLVYQKGKIAGYTMPLVAGMDTVMNFSHRTYRESNGISANDVVTVFRELHRVVDKVHARNVVIGDFNDLNVLTDTKTVRLVDADSMQYGGFSCRTYTSRFLDPLLSDGKKLVLARPHTKESDWYAYFIMLMQSLLYVGPYGGVHRPKSGSKLQHDARVLRRLTVLDNEVVYPKPALPIDSMPDEWLDFFHAVTTKDLRGTFPASLLDTLRFGKCTSCGLYHARAVCPACQAPGRVVAKLTIRGTVKAETVFSTKGRILQAAYHDGTLRYLYEESGALRREGGRQIATASGQTGLRYKISGERTLVGKSNVLVTLHKDGSSERQSIEMYREAIPVFDGSARSTFWVQQGRLFESGRLGPQDVGGVLSGQTMIWTGTSLGFGFYQASDLVRGFIFLPGKRGVNDQVDIRPVVGQLVDTHCAISDTHVWFFTTSQEAGRLIHRVQVIDRSGCIVGTASAAAGDDTWLGYGIRGHMAVGNSLFVATDDCLVRVGLANGGIVVEREFPDTEPFVRSDAWLLPGKSGIYVVSAHEIILLTIK